MSIYNWKLSIVVLIFISIGCETVSYEEPVISLDAYQVADGFEMQVIASEPFLEAPVTMDFDEEGRMWVVEMKGYMRNLQGTGEEIPDGTISILEDLDNDGVVDHSKIFLDGLVLPRAIAHVYGGLLYAESPNLWFVDIENDKPINKVLVDSSYAFGGNVEHQPNGLLVHIDNWIYNAKSNFRYQRKNGKWLKEPTTFRGQWGITRDDFGRLYYNNNSVQLIGDYVLPNTLINNPYLKPREGINKVLTKTQRVYPLHPTSVNRGYVKGVLDKDSLLVNVTSSCGPLIYRGNQFDEKYYQNAFSCVPEANLIKRNILSVEGVKITAKPAWKNREFIASKEEGFRPVNLFNGPDGAMYVVDMHRGIIQDKAYLTSYLQKQLAAKKLDTIIGMGRILKVKNKNKKLSQFPRLSMSSGKELVGYLESDNPWLRDKAQQLLILKNVKNTIPLLKKLAQNSDQPRAQIHALHTLNGLNALSFSLLEKIIKTSNPTTVAHVLILLESYASSKNAKAMNSVSKGLLERKDAVIDLYLCISLGSWGSYAEEMFFPMLVDLSKKYSKNKIYQESIVSGLKGKEENIQKYVDKESSNILTEKLKQTLENIKTNKKNSIFVNTTVATDSRTAGRTIYRNLCATCHGIDGNGIEGVAPPLRNSEYVEESMSRLALVILHGLHGPIHVDGKLYKLNGTMPGLVSNKTYSDADIANIISYMQNAFVSASKKTITSSQIKELRKVKPKVGGLFTEEELLNIKH